MRESLVGIAFPISPWLVGIAFPRWGFAFPRKSFAFTREFSLSQSEYCLSEGEFCLSKREFCLSSLPSAQCPSVTSNLLHAHPSGDSLAAITKYSLLPCRAEPSDTGTSEASGESAPQYIPIYAHSVLCCGERERGLHNSLLCAVQCSAVERHNSLGAITT